MQKYKYIENKGFNDNPRQNTYDIGLKGQNLVELKFADIGYSVYKKNFKKIGLEIDLIVYKFIQAKNLLVIRVVEVKTRVRNKVGVDLEQLGIEGKWRKVRKVLFDIPQEIKVSLGHTEYKHTISFDLAVVQKTAQSFKLNTYIRNVDLLL